MDEAPFWARIHAAFSSAEDLEEGIERLSEALEALSREEVVSFQVVMNAVMARAYTNDLISACCFLGFGQSDDGFEDFRAWLVAQGQATFESVVRDPDVLADLPFDESPTEEWGLEDLHMLPGEIGGEEDDPDWPYLDDPEALGGEPVVFEKAALRERHPRMWERFGDRFMIGIAD